MEGSNMHTNFYDSFLPLSLISPNKRVIGPLLSPVCQATHRYGEKNKVQYLHCLLYMASCMQ